MNPDRAIGGLLALSVALILLLGSWLLWRGRHPAEAPPEATASPSASPTASATMTPTGVIPAAARGYRLAGTVVGDVTYAIVEKPGGGNELLRPGQVLHGVGQVTNIGPDSIAIDGDDGRFELVIASAPTNTPTQALPSPSPGPPTPGPSTSESSPSAARDQSAF